MEDGLTPDASFSFFPYFTILCPLREVQWIILIILSIFEAVFSDFLFFLFPLHLKILTFCFGNSKNTVLEIFNVMNSSVDFFYKLAIETSKLIKFFLNIKN